MLPARLAVLRLSQLNMEPFNLVRLRSAFVKSESRRSAFVRTALNKIASVKDELVRSASI